MLPVRRGLVILMMVCCLATGCGSSPGITRANFAKIQKGMPRAEVEQLLGKPTSEFEGKSDSPLGAKGAKWELGDKSIIVGFDRDGKVAAAFGNRLE